MGASEAPGRRVDVVKGGASGGGAGCRVLDQLELLKGFVKGTEEE